MDSKKQWETPQLIVLGKGTPEENVLSTCKYTGGIGMPGPNCKPNLSKKNPGACSGLGQS